MVSLHEGDISPRPPTKGAMVPSSEPKQVGDSFFQAENEASLIAHGSRYQYRVTSTTIRVESSGSPTHQIGQAVDAYSLVLCRLVDSAEVAVESGGKPRRCRQTREGQQEYRING